MLPAYRREMSLGPLLRRYATMMNRFADASHLGGAWTNESRYFKREAVRGAISDEALVLRFVWWLQISLVVKVGFPRNLQNIIELPCRVASKSLWFPMFFQKQIDAQ